MTTWTVARQASLRVGFSRQEYWVGCHFLLQGIFPTQGSNPSFLCLPALGGGFFTTSATGKLVSYVLLNRKFEKLSGNEGSTSKLWFHLFTSYLLTLSGVFFQILV